MGAGRGQVSVWQTMGGTLQIILELTNHSKIIQNLQNGGILDLECSSRTEFSSARPKSKKSPILLACSPTILLFCLLFFFLEGHLECQILRWKDLTYVMRGTSTTSQPHVLCEGSPGLSYGLSDQ